MSHATEEIIPFTLHHSDEALTDLKQRLSNTRLPQPVYEEDGAHPLGVPLTVMQKLLDTWKGDYDWRQCEAYLNSLPQYTTRIDGIDLYFIHIKSKRPNALPLLLVHGWPGSILEFRHVIASLTDPHATSYRPFDLIIPALPGFAPSSAPEEPHYTWDRMANIFITLIQRLRIDRWVAQGGDWGADIVALIGHKAPAGLIGIHINSAFFLPNDEIKSANPTPEERHAKQLADDFTKDGAGYWAIQSTRPLTLGYLLADSPLGQAAWIYEKLHAWSTKVSPRYTPFDFQDILDNITLYWLGNAGAPSAMLYHEHPADNIAVPVPAHIAVGLSIFPHDTAFAPREWAERHYANLVHYRVVEAGGHFAAWEVPDLFVREVQDTFRDV